MTLVEQIKQISHALPAIASAATQQDKQQCLSPTTIDVHIHDGLARIAISGCFDFQMKRNFRNLYTPLLDNAAIREVWVDMGKVVYLDSSALGMLLLLNERTKAVNKPVTLLVAPGFVSQVLEVANFSKIFSIKQIGSENRYLSDLCRLVNNFPIPA